MSNLFAYVILRIDGSRKIPPARFAGGKFFYLIMIKSAIAMASIKTIAIYWREGKRSVFSFTNP